MHLRERVKVNLCDSELFKVKDCDSLRKTWILGLKWAQTAHLSRLRAGQRPNSLIRDENGEMPGFGKSHPKAAN